MAIISFDQGTSIDFVPEYGGNRDSENPCIIPINYVPYSKAQHYRRLMDAKNKGVTDPAKYNENEQIVQRQQFIENVGEPINYSVNGRKITDPGELYDTADHKLITEILLAMINADTLNKGQRKNS